VKLFPERRACKCGRSWGHYLPDDSTTVQTNYTLSIGMANSDFQEAVSTFMQDQNYFSPSLSMRAWINPHSEADVTYVSEDTDENQSEVSKAVTEK
jgi:hypothetical protein